MMGQFSIENIIFFFFFFSFSGWVGETIMESIVRKRFVNKGFFKGPYVPVHGIGGIAVYIVLFPLKEYPLLVYIAGTLLTTVVEYLAALLLEKAFNKKCWDYHTYPFTKGCHFQGRVALTTSLFFGLGVLALVYFYWDVCVWIMNRIGSPLLFWIDLLMITIFAIDLIYTFRKYIRNKRAGIPNKTDGLE
jgi:uncharacterized membrane protein